MTERTAVRDYPLSIDQEYTLLTSRVTPEPAVYNRPMGLRIRGPLRTEEIQEAFDTIVARHEPLRTRIVGDEDAKRQIVMPPAPVAIDLIDVDRLDVAMTLAIEDARRPFDLAAADPMRVKLFRIAPDDHLLLATMHHVVFDGWSEQILIRELCEIVDARRSDREPDLAPLLATYRELGAATRAELESGRFDDDLDYWARHLAGPLARVELPTDVPRTSNPRYQGIREPFLFPVELARRIAEFSRAERTTTFTVLYALLATLLQRYTNEDDLVIGSHGAGRHRVESETLIGLFVNSLALRVDASGNPTFRELIVRSRDTILAGVSRQRVPFGAVVKRLNPERPPNRIPFFSATLQWRNFPVKFREPAGLEIERVQIDSRTSKLDLAVNMWPDAGAIAGTAEYDTDLFEPETVRRMMLHLQRLGDSAVADPDCRIRDLPMMTDAERRSTIALWNGATTDYRPDTPLHTIVEERVAERPDAIAIVDGTRRITYAEMNARANRLAHRLVTLGAGRGASVAVIFERSSEFVIAILGVLKSGACYVPLDPTWPSPRIRLILEETESKLLVAPDGFHDPALDDLVRVVTLDDAAPIPSEKIDRNPDGGVRCDDAIYVMFTSGSTGRPKGVVLEHRSINRLVVNTDLVAIGPGDAVAFSANVGFDGSVFEIWGTLVNGATVVVVPHDVLMSTHAFEALLERESVTILFLTTSLARIFAAERPAMFRNVRALLIGGEAVDRSFRTIFGPGARPAKLIDAYGPTEAAVFAITHEIEDDPEDRRLVPVGRPIANSIAALLDDLGQPVPVGVPGEICLGGPGVARGYLRDPERTAARFIPDRFSGQSGGRLYRTGDRGRFRNDGRIEYLGRFDDQVKIRGYRIEPAEIESALASHPDVDRAIVAAVAQSDVEKRLTAWVKPRRPVDPAELRAFLSESLPEFMIPSRFVTIDAIPLTPNGKLDMTALPSPHVDESPIHELTPLEREINEMWKEILGSAPSTVDTDFFDAGGDSLNALHLAALIRRRLGREVSLDAFFRKPTIATIAASVVDNAPPADYEREVVAIHEGGGRTPAFLLPGGGGGRWELAVLRSFFDQLSNERPVHGLRSVAFVDESDDIDALVDRHLATIRRLRSEPPWILIGECVGGILAWEVASRLEAEHPGSTQLVMLDTRYPDIQRKLNLEKRLAGPLPIRERVRRHALALRRGRLPSLKRVVNVLTGTEPLENPDHELYNQRYARFLLGIAPTRRRGNVDIIVSEGSPIVEDVPRWQAMCDGEIRTAAVPGDHITYLRKHAATTARALDDILARAEELQQR